MHLHIAAVKKLSDRGCQGQNYLRQELYQRSLKLAVAALASVRVGCVELIAGRFQSKGQKLSQRRIHLQNLRGHPDGSSWLVKIRADVGSAPNIQPHGFFAARTELMALASWR